MLLQYSLSFFASSFLSIVLFIAGGGGGKEPVVVSKTGIPLFTGNGQRPGKVVDRLLRLKILLLFRRPSPAIVLRSSSSTVVVIEVVL
jgi:hypothetical protein